MVQPPAIDGIGRLVFEARQAVEGLYAGRHASPQRGGGVEFHDYRAYAPGDDLRAIDWKVFGRTDRYYLKRFHRETDLNLHIALDVSASMDFGGIRDAGRNVNAPTKLDVAKRLAAALAMLVIRQGDRVGLATLGGASSDNLPPAGAMPHLHRLIARLDQASPRAGQTDLASGLMQLHRSMRRRGVVVLISDLLDDPKPLFAAIDALRFSGSEAVVFQVLTPAELDLKPLGDQALRLIEPESSLSTKAQTRRISSRYQSLMAEHIQSIQRGLTARGCDHLLLRTDQPLIESLRRYLNLRSRRMNR